MDNRFSRRWSNSTLSLPATSQIPHVSPQKYVPPPYPNLSKGNSKQRWSTAPTSNSSLSIVETIDYDTDDTDSTAASTVSKRERSKAHLRGIMRQLFSRKEKDMLLSTPKKAAATRSIKTSKLDPVVLRHLERKEGDMWNRLSIIVRPSKPNGQQGTPKRVDSGVDVRNLKGNDGSSRYSKCSSATSLQSHRSSSQTAVPSWNSSISSNIPTPPPLELSQCQHDYLLTQIKTAVKLVQHQESETEAFSKNLAGLLWDKERYVTANNRLNQETKKLMVGSLANVREQTAKTFCRKGVFLERSLNVLEKLQEIVESTSPSPASRSPSLDSTESDTPTLTNSSSEQTTLPPLTLQTLQTALQTLKADLTAHSHLDPALRNTVVLPTQEVRFPSSENERIAMRRFVRFVDGRLKKLGEGSWEMGRWIRGLDGWVDDLTEAA